VLPSAATLNFSPILTLTTSIHMLSMSKETTICDRIVV
jgi:hypothetical protein